MGNSSVPIRYWGTLQVARWYRRGGNKEETFLARRRSISVSQMVKKLLIVSLVRARQPLGTLYSALNSLPPPPNSEI